MVFCNIWSWFFFIRHNPVKKLPSLKMFKIRLNCTFQDKIFYGRGAKRICTEHPY